MIFQKPLNMIFEIFFSNLWMIQVVWDTLHTHVDTVKSRERFGKPLFSHCSILGVDVNADAVASGLLTYSQKGSAPNKWIKNRIACIG